jgi:serine/threonine protein kinase
LKRIGKGGFGEVFLCKRKKSGELLALKKIPKAILDNKNQVAHIRMEQDVLAEASSQWLVQMFYTFQDFENIYFAMVSLSRSYLMIQGIYSRRRFA